MKSADTPAIAIRIVAGPRRDAHTHRCLITDLLLRAAAKAEGQEQGVQSPSLCVQAEERREAAAARLLEGEA
jgi:hypothetical protein